MSQTRYRSDFKRTWVRLGERGRRGCLEPRRGESLFSRIGLLSRGVVDKACVENKWKTAGRPKTVREEVHWTHRIVHYLRCYQTHLQDTNLRYSGQIGHRIDARKGTGMFLARASHCVRLNSAIPRRQNVRLVLTEIDTGPKR